VRIDYRARRVIVGGCASGIGQATARLLLAQGAQVHRYRPIATVLCADIFQQVDLREHAAIDASVGRIGGPLDAWLWRPITSEVSKPYAPPYCRALGTLGSGRRLELRG
jgi:NAD(P)-dependent dehydrogenase (short-subunit alcohol dehydrogenase family)